MKPASIIFLVLALVLMACGTGLCFFARDMATRDNVELFTEEVVGDDTVVRQELSEDNVSRFALTLKNCDVNIYGGAETSYIELINFPQNTYDLTVAAKTVTVDDTIGLLSIFNFTQNGFKFNGLRHYINIGQFISDSPKSINIYLSSDSEVKVFDIKIDSGNLGLSDLRRRADYTIDIGEGSVTMANVSTTSTCSISIKKGDLSMSSQVMANLTAEVGTGNLDFLISYPSQQNYSLTAALGTITVMDKDCGSTYETSLPIASSSITARTDNGSITVGAFN